METVEKLKIRDMDEFCKLFKINIPNYADFDYYIRTLKKSKEYEYSIDNYIKIFCELEQYVQENGIESVKKYKMQSLDFIKEYLENTQAYKSMMEKELPQGTLVPTRDWINKVEEDDLLISLDFASANYNVLKTFDAPADNELKKNWYELCELLEIHPTFIASKSFRQIVFGNTSPKRLQRFQHFNMSKVIEALKQMPILPKGLLPLSSYKLDDNKLVFISHDEIIIKVKDGNEAAELEHLSNKLSEFASGMPIRTTKFKLRRIKKDVFLKSVFETHDFYSSNNYSLPASFLVSEYNTLHGAPGNQFYMYFKKHILSESYDDRDLIYFNDGQPCMWVIQNDVKKKERLPHYEKLENVVSMDEAKTGYTLLWDRLGALLPNLTNEEKRRTVEIVANTCHYCWKNEAGCHCWDDE
jgi:hypothetical protein